jgi:hypothetical protein
MNKANIKATVLSQGWKDILEIFNDEILTEKQLSKVNTEKRYEDIAIETISRSKASKIVLKALERINRIANESDKPKESFR